MRIVLDENLPRPLRRIFGPEHQVATVQELGLAGTSNGALLARLEGGFDVFVTADKNLRSAEIASAVLSATPGSYLQVALPAPPGSNGPTP